MFIKMPPLPNLVVGVRPIDHTASPLFWEWVVAEQNGSELKATGHFLTKKAAIESCAFWLKCCSEGLQEFINLEDTKKYLP